MHCGLGCILGYRFVFHAYHNVTLLQKQLMSLSDRNEYKIPPTFSTRYIIFTSAPHFSNVSEVFLNEQNVEVIEQVRKERNTSIIRRPIHFMEMFLANRSKTKHMCYFLKKAPIRFIEQSTTMQCTPICKRSAG